MSLDKYIFNFKIAYVTQILTRKLYIWYKVWQTTCRLENLIKNLICCNHLPYCELEVNQLDQQIIATKR